ncbi:MAG: imidazole glycerol phosphate synthase subunit HisF [Candidatus Sericytochromatia bacterium]
MLKTRVIPVLLWNGSGLVKGVGFDSWRSIGSVLPAIKVYNLREVDELVLLNIRSTQLQVEPDVRSVAEFSAECFVPLTVGGGVSQVEHIRALLKAGADKVAINSAAYTDPNLIRNAATLFGTQCIVCSIDVRLIEGEYRCFSHSGSVNTGYLLEDWVLRVHAQGAGEILLTRIELDGTLGGYDLDLIRKVSDLVDIPVIASGGAGSFNDFYHAIEFGHASAVAAGAMFHFTEQTPKEAKLFLAEQGIATRRE